MGRFAVSTMFFHEYPCGYIFDYIAESGLDSLEFWVETPHFWLRDRPEDELVGCIADHPGLSPITVHAPTLDLNPCSINPRVAEISVEYTLEAVRMADRMGAAVVTVHPGRRTAKRHPSAYDYRRFDDYIAQLREVAGETQVKVAIENLEPRVNAMLYTPEDMAEVLEREPWLWFTLDMGHAMMTSSREVDRFIDLCMERMVNVHVSALGENGRPHHPVHDDPGALRVLTELADRGYGGYLTLELEDMVFPGTLSSEEKVVLLMQESEALQGIFS
ncbi:MULTISPECIES: sugar phosphate isomerase/epimerase family protein [unclassified Methanoculleus]|uniref:sugar phosphate isomerase/epimerase family protein n=1 Tax=unclassified Methanoculleus TaxID=2619537 RepID=UPI0025CF512D|nr:MULTISPECIES: sugar phosphate isomerase/epimerase family protein [unclassified Methanoculleus]MCK9318980.1 sugar phosphate isomerase/epimerase [Methanoculleus sp.]MDD2253883.1 sugar phosphate isomerase/epimerase [Methanoculleus sp.]MDD2786735.1 sugar phosphate isomerase/epimerase [Methanoculleus sp.]MDD3215584.1 sugar phosphate isomerase/epimerase [Methanoculleus sp.]MDD4314864.1 sugar phosphate isomerase/epimerase [Methanoculleus sp.]